MHSSMLNYGEFIQFFIGPKKRTLMINNPEGVEWVMLKNAKNYTKNTPGYRRVAAITGDGVFTDDGPKWSRARKVIQPFFSQIHLERYFQVTRKSCSLIKDEIDDHLRHQSVVNVSPFMTKHSLTILGECIFGTDLGDYAKEIDRELSVLIDVANDSINDVLPFPSKRKKDNRQKMKNAQHKLNTLIKELIANSYQDEIDPGRNLIHALREASDSDEQFVLNQVKTLIFAGHETSANVMSWTLYFLAKEKEWRHLIIEELKQKVSGDLPTFEELNQLEKLKMFVRESMRLRPPAWSFGRIALKEDVIFDEKVLPGDVITISPFLMHHNPRLYNDPLQFNPEHFNEENMKKRPKGAYMPFGLGPRFCLGVDLAMIEIMTTMVTFLNYFKFPEHMKEDVLMESTISLRPLGGVKLELSPLS